MADELVAFFNSEDGQAMGRKGDYEMWTPEQTAAHFLREHVNCPPPVDLNKDAIIRLRSVADTLSRTSETAMALDFKQLAHDIRAVLP